MLPRDGRTANARECCQNKGGVAAMSARGSVILIVEMVEGGGNTSAASLDVFAECLRTDSVDRWAAKVRGQIADNRRAAVPAATPIKDVKADRAQEIESQIRELQSELQGLVAGGHDVG